MKGKVLLLLVLAFSAGEARAQGYASTDAYREDLKQAHIRQAATQTLLGFRLLQRRYEITSKWLSAIADHPRQGRVVGPGGRYEMTYRMLEAGAANFDAATTCIDALESLLRRIEAGQRFHYATAELFIVDAQRQLFAMQWMLAYQERIISNLASTVARATGTGTIQWGTLRERRPSYGYRELVPVKDLP
jgi:hypothetical protein